MGFFSSPSQASLAVDTAVEACQVSSADLEVWLSLGRGGLENICFMWARSQTSGAQIGVIFSIRAFSNQRYAVNYKSITSVLDFVLHACLAA